MTPAKKKNRHTPLQCRAEQNGVDCTRQVEKLGDLVCKGHWKMVPHDLRQLLIKKQTARMSKQKQKDVIAAAGLVLAYIETCLVTLPDAPENTNTALLTTKFEAP